MCVGGVSLFVCVCVFVCLKVIFALYVVILEFNDSCLPSDMDECLADTDNCDHVCINTVGSFTCSCGPAYLGTGNDCRGKSLCL